LAEETGLIVEIGFWVFKEAVHQVSHWKKLFNEAFQISVNRSPVQFQNHLGLNYLPIITYLDELQLSGRSIVFEITEGLLLDAHSGVTDTLIKFRDEGIQVALDDFGTGYSALSYLKKFDIDYLKIDKSFVDHMATDASDLALCEAIIVMAHKLGLKVIAEGVETEAQRRLLADSGCDYAQGYLFSKPVPPEEFEKLLEH
jgi:EAL domain-containing protein (putative c-di-GMP-specific phosphodiesterase class I)